jgi:hypothetical protein
MRQPAGASKCIGYDELRLNIKPNSDSAEETPEAKEGRKISRKGETVSLSELKSLNKAHRQPFRVSFHRTYT